MKRNKDHGLSTTFVASLQVYLPLAKSLKIDKKATVVNISDREIIKCFQEGLGNHRMYEQFGLNRPTNIKDLKEMIQRWADEEDHANTRFGNRFVSPGDNYTNNDHRGGGGNYSRKRGPDNTVAAMQPKRNNDNRSREERQKAFVELLQKQCPWHPESRHSAWDCYSLWDAFRYKPKHPRNDKKHKDKDKDKDKEDGEDDGAPGDFQQPENTVNVIFGGIAGTHTRRSQKLALREVMAIEPATPAYL